MLVQTRSRISASAIAALAQIGVTHVFVQLNGYTADQHAVMESSPELTRTASDEGIVLYQVNRR